MSTTDSKIDVNVPPSRDEVDAWVAGLSETDKAELKRQQLQNAAVTRKPDTAPDFSSMTDEQLEDFKRKNGFYR